ncbi:UbiH/UbiF/VisC/COQ6 family ubiquinone biosynthesis hydroxylase [Gynuella sunshinyii]|uniref:2-polyprenyl-6-methoxyphenol hydroxylase and related FAD-dependent oxidoreductase n=1 Tax=Gynuella sunshinyii YC6258 TaxID=1445510 RepID=A0A0C5VKT6_9GAMM|nr:UbiH/UbiF/VisC/COQ6 family ubiquinone biosynthesis hydroxylase [Gynuella sunshinyii]AJQ94008.1 2-polyprenyl-6-methoxyphenol hydroxylase and related FAD-dependent oxidoreductase [Gynuella sunshinyii YC6258]
MSNAIDFDVLVVGGGMVGASLALGAARAGLSVAIIEAHSLSPASMSGVSGFEPRVSAINHAARNWLKYLGVWDDINQSRVCNYHRMEVWEADGTGEVSFSAQAMNIADLGCIIENQQIQQALVKGISTTSGIRTFEALSVTALHQQDDHTGVSLGDGTYLTARLVVGADGHESKVRELAGFKTSSWDYHHQALVTSVKTEKPHQYTARQIFTAVGPLAFLPLSHEGMDEHWCSIVWSINSHEAEDIFDLPEETFKQRLARSFEFRLGTIQEVDQRYLIPLQQRFARSYVQPGVALVGDAAHRIHPLAGQGVNLGFLDAATLTETLAKTVRLKQSPGSLFYLRQYQRQRQAHNLAMMAAMEGFKRLYEADALPVRWLRNQGMKWFEQLPWLKHECAKAAVGLTGPLPSVMS